MINKRFPIGTKITSRWSDIIMSLDAKNRWTCICSKCLYQNPKGLVQSKSFMPSDPPVLHSFNKEHSKQRTRKILLNILKRSKR